jgi:hypothetical protein
VHVKLTVIKTSLIGTCKNFVVGFQDREFNNIEPLLFRMWQYRRGGIGRLAVE